MQPRRLQVHFIVREHEADALMLAERPAEGLPAARMIGGDVMGAAGLAEPTHAMGEPCRRQPHLRVAETLANLAEHIGGGNADILEIDHRMAAGETGVHRLHLAGDADAGSGHICQEHGGGAIRHARHDDCVIGTLGAGDEPFAAVDHVVGTIWCRRRQQHRRIGAGTGWRLGHGKARACVAGDLRPQPAFLLRGARHLLHQMDIAFIRRMDIERCRPQPGIACLLEDDRLFHMAEPEAAEVARGMRRQ